MPPDPRQAQTFGDLLREHRRSRPEAIAAVDGDFDRDVRLTFAQLDDRVNRLCGALTTAGVGAGDRILWLGQNSFRVLEGLAAAAKLGAMFCPVNWRQTADELAFVLDDLTPRVVVWQEAEIGDGGARRARPGRGRDGRCHLGAARRRRVRGLPRRRRSPSTPTSPSTRRRRCCDLHRGVRRPTERRDAHPHRAHHAGPRAGRRHRRRRPTYVLPELGPAVPRRHVHDDARHLRGRRHQRVHAPGRRRGAVPADRSRSAAPARSSSGRPSSRSSR